MQVIKRDGSKSKLEIKQIRKQTIPACDGLSIQPEEIEFNAKISFTTDIKTTDIQELLIKSALSLTNEEHSDAQIAAGRLHLFDMYHRIKRNYFGKKINGDIYIAISFKDYVEFNKERLSWYDNDFYRNTNFEKFDLEELDNYLEPKRDLEYTYIAIEMLEERYLLHTDNEVSELPQHLFMSLACFAAQNEEDPNEWAKIFYDMLSKKEFHPGTPTLANGRTIKKVKDKVMLGNCFSCAVGSFKDDLISIFDGFKIIALGSKFGSGWGYDITRIRALGGYIQDIPGVAGGSIPWMKILNDIAIGVDQLGTRNGAINVTMESWSLDIEDFIKAKSNGGEDKRTTKELFISISCSDVFMERVKNNEEFTLFDPYDVPILTETYGDEFREHYLKYEEIVKTNPDYFTNKPKVINAKTLWKKMQNMYYETGMPFLTFKDNINKTTEEDYDYKEVGIIRSANLCQEYIAAIKDDEITLCNLGSINISKINDDKHFKELVYNSHRFLDNIIDITAYAIPNSEETQKERRSVGLGLAGEAEYLANNQIVYGSKEHFDWVDKFYSKFKEYSDNASLELGKERGACMHSKKGYRNLYRRAIAPTSSISILMGTSSSIEAVFDRIWIEENAIGNVVTTAPNLNKDNYLYYINPYTIDQIELAKLMGLRQKYIDMGISYNLYFDPERTTGKYVFDTIMSAWESGVKTTYYLRSKSKKKEIRNVYSEIACFGCAG